MLVLPLPVATRPPPFEKSTTSSFVSSSSKMLMVLSNKTKVMKLKKAHTVSTPTTGSMNTKNSTTPKGGETSNSHGLLKDVTFKNQCKSAVALVKERRIEFIRAKKASSSSSSRTLHTLCNSMEKKKVLMSREEIESFLVWKQVKKIGPGLCNLGNTCYLNSVLQCLAYTPGLVQYLLTTQEVSSSSSSSSSSKNSFCGLKSMTRFLSSVHQNSKHKNIVNSSFGSTGGSSSSGRVLQPKEIVLNLRHLSKHFRIGRQEDAHEFYRLLLDAMQKSCLKKNNLKETDTSPLASTSLVHRLFGGQLQNTLKCTKCGFCSEKKDDFLDLSLEIFPSKIQTLSKAFQHFTQIEILDQENAWKCTHCRQLTRAEKGLKIHTIPNVLTIQLKRFDGVFGGKIKKHIEFSTVLDLKKYMSTTDPNTPTDPNTKYQLYGVLVHAGFSTNCGHYYAFIKSMSGQWYEMNDESVRWVNVDTVLQQRAYMLFYTRVLPTKPTAGPTCTPNPTSVPTKPTIDVAPPEAVARSTKSAPKEEKEEKASSVELDMKSFLTSLKRQVPDVIVEEEEAEEDVGEKQEKEEQKVLLKKQKTSMTTFTVTKCYFPKTKTIFAPTFTGLLGKLHQYQSKWKPFHIQMSMNNSSSSSFSTDLTSISTINTSSTVKKEPSVQKPQKTITAISSLEFHPRLLKDFGGNAAVFGKSISKWEEEEEEAQQQDSCSMEQKLVAKQEEIMSKLKKEDWHHRRGGRQDEWNETLDMGKVKKLKKRKEFIANEGKQNAFQLVLEQNKKNKTKQKKFIN